MPAAAHLHQQRVVLHIARAHLEHVRVLRHLLHQPRVHHFGDDGQAGFLAGFAQDPQPFQAQTLEIVGRSAGLVGAAAQHVRPGAFHGAGDFQRLLAALHRARPGNDHRALAAEAHPAHLHHARLAFAVARIGPAAQQRADARQVIHVNSSGDYHGEPSLLEIALPNIWKICKGEY